MTNAVGALHDWTLVQDAETLSAVIEHARVAPRIGVDVEANGLFVYRPRLCTVQVAWEEQGRTKIAIIDTLRVNVAALVPLFTAPSPIKILHDLTFDARMLHDSGASLAHVWDTSVAARLLGVKATGLAAVVTAELGVVLDKRYQQHDWSRRPLEPMQLAYLSNDVAHLLPLEQALRAKVEAMDIAAEVEAECGYKLVSALAPPRDQRPHYIRIKGVQRLDPIGRAILRHLATTREDIASTLDVPAFKVITNEILLEIARKRPRSPSDLGRIRGALSGRAGRYTAQWLAAVTTGIADGDVPAVDREFFQPPPFDRVAFAKRREIEGRLNAFRKLEAERRGVNEQVVLPGHCVQDLAKILGSTTPRDPDLVPRIAAVAGIGAKRAEQYADVLVALMESTNAPDPMFFSDPHDEESSV